MEAEPAHRVLIHAKGIYERGSDELKLNGERVGLDLIQIMGVSTKDDCLKSHARLSHISLYMIDNVFSSFVELLRNNTDTGEILIKLDSYKLKDSPEILRISFDGMDVTRNAGGSIRDQTLANTLQARIVADLKTSKNLLFAIAAMTGLILLHFLFR
jgi:hypothetical protein